MKDISFQTHGLRLDGTICYPKKTPLKSPAVLFIQGWTGERTRSFQYAEGLSKLGFISFLVDLPGRGTSQGRLGPYSFNDFLNYVLDSYDLLSEIDGVDKNNISAVGSSFGGYMVALLSTKRKVKNLVLRAPANYPNSVFNISAILGVLLLRVPIWTKNIGAKNYALQALRNYKGNVLIVESEKDETIPRGIIRSYRNAANKDKLTYKVLKGAPHSISEGKFRDAIEKILVEWFKDKVSK